MCVQVVGFRGAEFLQQAEKNFSSGSTDRLVLTTEAYVCSKVFLQQAERGILLDRLVLTTEACVCVSKQ